MQKKQAHHDLNEVKRRIIQKSFTVIKGSATTPAREMGLDPENAIPDAILLLTNGNFYKSKEDYYIENDWQDAYIINYEGHQIYIKFVIRTGTDILIITSFHPAR